MTQVEFFNDIDPRSLEQAINTFLEDKEFVSSNMGQSSYVVADPDSPNDQNAITVITVCIFYKKIIQDDSNKLPQPISNFLKNPVANA